MQDMNENKRFLLALFLSIIVATVYMQYFVTPAQRPQRAMQEQTAAAPAGTAAVEPSQAAQQLPAATNNGTQQAAAPVAAAAKKHPSLADLKNAHRITVESDKFIISINELGGRLEKVLLKGYTLQLGKPDLLDMVYSVQGGVLPLALQFGSINDDFVKYEVRLDDGKEVEGDSALRVPATGELGLQLIGALPDGRQIRKNFHFKEGAYLFDLDVSLSAPEKDASPIWLEWSRFVSTESAAERYNQKDFLMLDEAGKLVRIPSAEMEQGVRDVGKGAWISISDQHFMTTLIPESAGAGVRVGREGDVLISQIRGGETAAKFKVFTGPKVYEDLETYGYSLEKNVDLGMFSFLAYPILLLLRIFYSILGNYGLAIILLTLVIKIVFLPLTSASFRSMQAMQEIQPEVQALRERIDDSTKLNQELMALYKRRGVNPLGGCLPVMIQIPVFLGLYNGLLNAIELRHAPFALWITDLSAPERLEMFGIGVPLMILIMGASMLIQQWTTPSGMDPAQKKAFMLMPVMFTVMFIVFPMPSGLVLYWLINNVISIVQQQFLRKQKGIGPMQATLISSVAIFILGYILVLI